MWVLVAGVGEKISIEYQVIRTKWLPNDGSGSCCLFVQFVKLNSPTHTHTQSSGIYEAFVNNIKHSVAL